MGLTSAMLTGFTGIKSNQYSIDTIGDNVANVNTTAFKNQRALFETMFYDTLRSGTAPGEETGGTNPAEVGHGSALASIQRNFTQGAIESTGVPSDVAIQGEGFFVLNTATGDQAYTRDGSFSLDSANTLVSSDGSLVQGFAADANGDIVEGVLSDLVIPLGASSAAQATTTAVMDGNLDPASEVAATPAVVTSAALSTAGGTASGTTALADLVDEDGVALFANGDVLTLSGAEKGGLELPEATFVVGTDGSTLDDLATFIEQALRINTDSATGGTPGVIVGDGTTGPAGALVITSNLGEENAISVDGSDIRNATSGVLPFTFTATPATGEGTSTAVPVFDSVGNLHEVRLQVALESKDDTGSVWRFYAESSEDTAGGVLGTGTISFDQNGQFLEATGTNLAVNIDDTGAVSPLALSLDMSNLTGLAGADGESVLVTASQDGMPAGTLTEYEVGPDGIITGTYSNQATQVLGQLALATFTNPEGLVGLTDNTFGVGENSGAAVILAPQTEGAGRIESGALELSNVDLSREFIGLITASTGFSAAGRVVRTADDLLQELLMLVR